MMKLHWSRVSPYVRKVLVCAHELGVADRIEIVPSKVAMTVPNQDLMRDNPLGKVPALVNEDGDCFFDSLVICEYLASIAPANTLFPQDEPARWDALRWHAIGNGMSDALILWFRELLRAEPQQLPDLVEILKLKIRACIPVLDAELAQVGEQPLHVGHIAVATALAYIDFRFPEIDWRTGHPGLGGWYEALAQRPSMRATVPY
jgi:glutathione S-transferase